MNNFKDFNIRPSSTAFIGDKIKISKIFDKQVSVHKFKIVESKLDNKKGNGKCLHLQIEMGKEMYLVCTGSATLQDMIQRVDKEKFPFTTTVIKENERYQFT
jgi:hypothetical protein